MHRDIEFHSAVQDDSFRHGEWCRGNYLDAGVEVLVSEAGALGLVAGAAGVLAELPERESVL